MKWHFHLSISFNQKNDTHFQNYYKKFLVKFKFIGNQIYNLVETSVTNVVQAPHTVAQTGVKQNGHALSAKRDPLISLNYHQYNSIAKHWQSFCQTNCCEIG